MMRYRESGEVHKDFHGALNTTIDYIATHYGEAALSDLFRKMGQDVYRSIHEKLKNGDPSELIEHLEYFMTREDADFQLETAPGRIELTVKCCPAVAQLQKLGLTPSPYFCRQTSEVNAAMCEGSPWRTETEITGCGSCRQIFTREANHDSK